MTTGYVKSLKERLVEAEEEAQAWEAEAFYYKSLVECFFSGDIPERSSLTHHVLAKYGRKRLEEMKHVSVLLQSQDGVH